MNCLLLSAVTASLVVTLPQPVLALEPIANANGLTIGYLDKKPDRTVVKDACSRSLGYTTDQGAFTPTAMRLANSPLPFLCSDRKRAT